ncbi:hypothetical protein EVG20_g5746, partial [Dentipellis fragilis]
TAGVPEAYSRAVFRFYANYAMLVVNSFGLQNALERTPVNIPHFFARVHTAAKSVALIVRDELGRGRVPQVLARLAFCVWLLIRPEFPASLDVEDETLALASDVADMFDNVAAGPAAYTRAVQPLSACIASQSDQPPASAPAVDPSAGTEAGSGGGESTKMDADPQAQSQQGHFYAPFSLSEFQFASEMGPVADMSTFPPTMAAPAAQADEGVLSMDSILSGSFWDNVLVPGYANPMEGLSGGFVYGSGGSGFITPHFGPTPHASGANSPERASLGAGVGDFVAAPPSQA